MQSPRRTVVGLLLVFSLLIIYPWWHHDATLRRLEQAMDVVGLHGGLPAALTSRPTLDALPKTLLTDPKLVKAPFEAYNVSLCAIVTNEHAFIDEWVLYHRLLGVQRFHLYDFEASPKLANILARYMEAGIVDLHTITFEDSSIPSDNFHGRMLAHCIANHARKTRWLAHIDVDEFFILSDLLNYSDRPYQLDPSSPASPWTYPLHDLVLSDWFRLARCVTLSRDGMWRNVGVVSLKPQESILENLFYRDSRRGSAGEGKVLLQSSPDGLLAKFDGAHRCKVENMPHVNGVQDWNRDAIRDSSGRPGEGKDPRMVEPLAIAHFDQRTLEDCHAKFKHITDPNNWRILNGGTSRCDRLFIPSQAQLASGFFDENPNYDYDKIMEVSTLSGPIIRDRHMIDSWYGQQTVQLLAKVRAGQSLPLRDRTATEETIERIKVPNPVVQG